MIDCNNALWKSETNSSFIVRVLIISHFTDAGKVIDNGIPIMLKLDKPLILVNENIEHDPRIVIITELYHTY